MQLRRSVLVKHHILCLLGEFVRTATASVVLGMAPVVGEEKTIKFIVVRQHLFSCHHCTALSLVPAKVFPVAAVRQIIERSRSPSAFKFDCDVGFDGRADSVWSICHHTSYSDSSNLVSESATFESP